jgi:hypothetical protein
VYPQQYAELRAASSKQSTAPDDERWLNANQVKAAVGCVSSMCIWRWTNDPRVQFPKPDAVLNGRRYWKVGTIRRWQAAKLIQHPVAAV